MSEEEFFNRAINRICKDYDYNFANEFKLLFKKKEQEIERQKEVINGMIDNEEKYCLEINKLKSIIKEVRELIKELMKYYNGEIGEKTDYLNIHIGMINELLEILDKKENK